MSRPAVPPPSSPAAEARMKATRRRDTAAEMRVRRELHRRGLRYRLDEPPIPSLRRRADIVFRRQKLAVYVDGCFWHSCPIHATVPKANREWWIGKLAGNVRRDRATDEALVASGWRVVRIWEHEEPREAADRVVRALNTS